MSDKKISPHSSDSESSFGSFNSNANNNNIKFRERSSSYTDKNRFEIEEKLNSRSSNNSNNNNNNNNRKSIDVSSANVADNKKKNIYKTISSFEAMSSAPYPPGSPPNGNSRSLIPIRFKALSERSVSQWDSRSEDSDSGLSNAYLLQQNNNLEQQLITKKGKLNT